MKVFWEGIIRRLWVCLLVIASNLGALDLNLSPDANSLASANMTILNDTPSSVFSLPSIGTTGYESSIAYLYSDSNLPLYSLFLGHDLYGGIVGVGSQVLSHPLYNESHVLINYHRNWNLFYAGMNERLLFASIKNGSHSSSFVTDMGAGFKIPVLETAIGIHNIFHARYQDVALAETYVTEMSYHPAESTSIGLGCEKQKGYDASLRLTTKYWVTSAFRLTAGYQYQPDRFSGGVEFTCKRWQLCYGMQTHPDLDLTHAISLTWK